jgi:hypothetical protein
MEETGFLENLNSLILVLPKFEPSHLLGMVQKRPFSGNTWDLSADADRSRVGAGVRDSLVTALGLQFWENRLYPRSSSQ